MKKSLFTFTCALFCAITAFATDYPVTPGTVYDSYALPIFFKEHHTYGSIVQQIYLASELTSSFASTGADITALKFYYTAKDGNSEAISRDIKVFLLEIPAGTTMYDVVNTSVTEFGNIGKSMFFADANNKPGTLVYDGEFNVSELSSGTSSTISIPFDNAFPWDGTKNIVVTIFDMSETSNTMHGGWSKAGDGYNHLKFKICNTGALNPRFLHYVWRSGIEDDRSTWLNNIRTNYGETYNTSTTVSDQQTSRSYVAKADFTITTRLPLPTSPSSSSISTSSATISWTAVAGADSYEVRYGTTSGSLGAATNVGNVTSYDLSDLEEETTYYYQIRTIKGSQKSAWTAEASFVTAADVAHTHDDLTFIKWSTTNAMPTSGTYYLNSDITLTNNVTLAGNLNLCLNGHTLDAYAYSITVPDGYTFTLFDNEGGGKITSGFASTYGVVTVASGGTFVLKEGEIENTANAEDGSNAIYNGGTLQFKGAPIISGATADISMGSGAIIALTGAITNGTPYSVYKPLTGNFTSGWNTYMGDANPWDYFIAANPAQGVYRNGDEATMIKALHLAGTTNNASTLSTENTRMVYFTLSNRTITSSQYNTLCLPFALDNAQLEEVFGSGYDLEEFDNASVEGNVLNLSFTKVTSLTAGKPYLIQPANDVINPTFVRVTIDNTNRDQTSDAHINFKGVYSPTELTGGNKNLLFLGANNELLWPEATANLNGFRAYFEKKGAAVSAIHARIVQKEDAATGINQITNDQLPMTNKFLRNGELLLLRDGRTYNTLGQRVK